MIILSNRCQVVLKPHAQAQSVHLRFQLHLLLVAIPHYLLQQLVIYREFDSFDVFIVLQLLPTETVRIVPVNRRHKEVCILVALPGIIVQHRHGSLHDLVQNIPRFLQQLPPCLRLVVFTVSHASGKPQNIVMHRCSELNIHQQLCRPVLVPNDGNNIDAFNSICLVRRPEDLLVVVNRLVANRKVNILYP
jgi:hypothetical protein